MYNTLSEQLWGRSVSQESLYIVLLGGKHEKANVEIHDVIPVVAEDLKQIYPYLKQQWFGMERGLHIDGWMKINGTTYQQPNEQPKHYRIEVKTSPQKELALKLYLINLGAYLPTQFGEVHKYVVVAAKNKTEAKIQGKLAIEKAWFKPHTDAIVDIDDCLELKKIQQKYLHLIEEDFDENTFVNDYIVIG